MKRLNFKTLAIGLFLTLLPCFAHASESTDSVRIQSYEYHQRLLRRQRQWDKLIPNLFTLQYAGDIGTISMGFGWDYGPKDKWETHVLLGYITPRRAYRHYWTLTFREIYNPWQLRLHDNWSITPLSVNISINSILHSDFWTSEPDRYPHGYYGFSSRIRFHLGLGQRFSFHLPEEKRFLSSKISLYYEVSTCDLYVRQKFLNKDIPLKEIIALAVGVVCTI